MPTEVTNPSVKYVTSLFPDPSVSPSWVKLLHYLFADRVSNVQPGHGTAGRHPTREFLDSLSGHDDPGMFGKMFPGLDPLVVSDGPLQELAGGGGSLPFRNLRRGVMLGLPAGQDVAVAMSIQNALTPDEIVTGPDGAVAKKHNLHTKTPLWYYILKEAEIRAKETLKNSALPILDYRKSMTLPFLQLRFRLFSVCPKW